MDGHDEWSYPGNAFQFQNIATAYKKKVSYLTLYYKLKDSNVTNNLVYKVLPLTA